MNVNRVLRKRKKGQPNGLTGFGYELWPMGYGLLAIGYRLFARRRRGQLSRDPFPLSHFSVSAFQHFPANLIAADFSKRNIRHLPLCFCRAGRVGSAHCLLEAALS